MSDLPGGARPRAMRAEPTVMVIDHDAGAREVAAQLFREHGYRVDACAGAREAIERLAEGAAPSVILLELLLPEMDGWEFRVRQLREAAWAHIPVVALSSDTSAKARAIHADAFLAKPVSNEVLLETVDRLLQFPAGKRLQSYLAHGERDELTAPLAGIAHEINNSLAYVLGTLELAETKARELESRLRGADAFTMVGLRQLVARAQRGADRIVSVVRELEKPRRAAGDERRPGELPFPRDAAHVWYQPRYSGERETRRADPAFVRGQKRRPTVLVVDDESMICELVNDILEEDYDVVSFTDPRAALATLLSGSFDVVVCDLLMPELTGMDLYEQLASQRSDLINRVIFLSGGGFTDGAREFLARVRRPQVKKPFHQSELLDAIEEQLMPKH
ncbi:MAG: hybrid sensor histidine kinase/response regulator [Myxococcaceae bacterium]|nr:hybrid sensor histidine kinase/response regulator [Myxococcaceae bacterium]